MTKPDVPLPPLTPAVAMALDPAYRHAYGRLVATRLAAARQRLVAVHGDLYSQERVGQRLQQSQTWISNLELGQRRVDTGALMVLSALYQVSIESLVMAPSGRDEEGQMERWMREYRALVRGLEPAPTYAPPAAPPVRGGAKRSR